MRFSAAPWKPQKKYRLKIAENGVWQLFSSPDFGQKEPYLLQNIATYLLKDYDFDNIASIVILIGLIATKLKKNSKKVLFP